MNKRSSALVKPGKCIRILKILTLLLLIFHINALAQQTVQYVYDDNGRLRAVTHPSGDITVYDYDAEGNVLAVRREQSTTVSLIYFTPKRGTMGASVQIFGTGFSANIAENTVKFNGVDATVQAATLTRLTVIVPVGASSGTISVTTPIGTATSDEVFSIIEAPEITDFFPRAGKTGEEIFITGSNFDLIAANNIVSFNGTSATVLSTSPGGIIVEVPASAASGRITVANGAGSDISDQEFFVLPDNYDTTGVFYTSRINFNQAESVLFNPANEIAMFIFDGVAGQSVSLKVTVGTTFFGINPQLNLGIINPDNSTLVSPTPLTSLDRGLYLDTFILPQTGTYTIILDKTNYPSSSGTATITVFDVPPDATGTVEIDGPAAEIANTAPGQNARLTFTGTAGQRFNLLGEVLQINNNARFSVLNPDGSMLVSPTFASYSSVFSRNNAFAENVTLPVDGIYTVFIDPFHEGVFASRVKLSTPPTDISGTISADGNEVVFTTTEPGQNVEVTFNGVAGQRISLKMQHSGGIYNNLISVVPPNGFPLVNNQYTSSSYFMDAVTLTETGVYRIILNPSEEETGTISLRLYNVPPDATATAEISGPAIDLSTTVPGQNLNFAFEGTEGQNIAVKVSNHTYYGFALIESPDGGTLASVFINGNNTLIENLTLPSDGTYKIYFDPPGERIGNITVQIFDATATEFVESIDIDGAPLSLNFTAAFQKARITFSATAGQTVRIAFNNITVPSGKLSVLDPDGTPLLNNFNITPPTSSRILTNLPVSGTYTIIIDPDVENTGQMELSLTSVTDLSASITIDGAPANISLVETQAADITFSGSAGQRVFIKFDNATSQTDFTITQPSGAEMESGSFSYKFGYDFHTLPETGTYTIRAVNNPYEPSSFQVSALTTASIARNEGMLVRFLNPNQTANIAFQSDAGTNVTVIIPNTSFSNGIVNIYNPDDTLLNSASIFDFFISFVTQQSGAHRIEIVPAQSETGFVQLSFSSYSGGDFSSIYKLPEVGLIFGKR